MTVFQHNPFLGLPLIPLFSFSHRTAKRSFNKTPSNQANEQLTVHFSKPRPPAPPKPQAPPQPTTAPAAADARARPTPAPRAQPASLKKPPLKKPGVKAPNCPPPLPPPSQGKAVPSVAQWEKWRVPSINRVNFLVVVLKEELFSGLTFHLAGVMYSCTPGRHDITVGCGYRCNKHASDHNQCCVTIPILPYYLLCQKKIKYVPIICMSNVVCQKHQNVRLHPVTGRYMTSIEPLRERKYISPHWVCSKSPNFTFYISYGPQLMYEQEGQNSRCDIMTK